MKYALKALIYIANHKDGLAIASAIAAETAIPKKFLEQILLELKKGRIINSKQGNVGGYYFVKDPKDVNLVDVYRLIEGPIAWVPCVSKTFYEPCSDCSNETECRIRWAAFQIRDPMLEAMEQINIATLAAP